MKNNKLKFYEVDIVQKRTFTFSVGAEDEQDAMLQAYNVYCYHIDQNDVDNFLMDEDLEYEVCNENEVI